MRIQYVCGTKYNLAILHSIVFLLLSSFQKMARKVANGQIEEEDLMVRDLMVVCMTGL
jgi:hypothetical protein